MPTRMSSLVWVTDSIAVGAAPLSCAQLADLHHQGVTAILNLCGEFCDLPEAERDHGFEVRHLPIPDEEAPDLAALEEALAWLDEAVYLGKKVYIHCRHGLGRTGTVLNAYMLRRGLGHWAAGKILSGLRSKPANFRQWRAVRKFGKSTGRLKIRKPRLDFARDGNLETILAGFEDMMAEVESAAAASRPGQPRCGLDHDACCHGQVKLSLVEALALARAVDRELTSPKRRSVMDRAGQACSQELDRSDGPGREEDDGRSSPYEGQGEGQGNGHAREDAGEIISSSSDCACPLLEDGHCLLFYARPLACRLSGMDAYAAQAILRTFQPELDSLSSQVFQALCGKDPPEALPSFELREAISGRYVQRFFDHLKFCALPKK